MREFINLKVTISLDLNALSKEEYNQFSNFFALTDSNIPLDNKEVIELLALDKRPFFVSEKQISTRSDELIRTANIDLIC